MGIVQQAKGDAGAAPHVGAYIGAALGTGGRGYERTTSWPRIMSMPQTKA